MAASAVTVGAANGRVCVVQVTKAPLACGVITTAAKRDVSKSDGGLLGLKKEKGNLILSVETQVISDQKTAQHFIQSSLFFCYLTTFRRALGVFHICRESVCAHSLNIFLLSLTDLRALELEDN